MPVVFNQSAISPSVQYVCTHPQLDWCYLVWIVPGARTGDLTDVLRVVAEVVDHADDAAPAVVDVGELTEDVTSLGDQRLVRLQHVAIQVHSAWQVACTSVRVHVHKHGLPRRNAR